MTEAEVLALVAEAGEQLKHDLRTAERISEGYADLSLGGAAVTKAIDRCLDQLSTTQLWGPINRLPSGRLWEIAGDYLQHGALLHRARFKPRGYAGDDTMLRLICEDWRCDHPLGRMLDAYFQGHAAPQAVRNRTQIVAGAIAEAARVTDRQQLHVTSIGSGPALDIVWGASILPSDKKGRLKIQLLDLDPQALAEAAGRVAAVLSPSQVVARRENLYRLPKLGAEFGLKADLIACTGFFDYLNQADAAALLAFLWQQLAPGGRLMVFNFAPHNSSRALMEWMGNWYLTYRDEAAMHELALSAAIPEEAFRISAEEQGVDLFIDATKPA